MECLETQPLDSSLVTSEVKKQSKNDCDVCGNACDELLCDRSRAFTGLTSGSHSSQHDKINIADLKQIECDVSRTSFGSIKLTDYHAVIVDLLCEYAIEDTEVGYCQGMNYVAAVCARQFGSTDVAYPHFRTIVHGIRGLWLPGFPLLLHGVVACELLCSSLFQDLYTHLQAHMLQLDMFLPDTWLTLFSRWLPVDVLWEAFEVIETEGFPYVLALTAEMMKAHTTDLMALPDFTSLFSVMKKLGHLPSDLTPSALLTTARDLLPAARDAMDTTQGMVRADTSEILFRDRTVSSLARTGCCVRFVHTGLELLDGQWLQLSGAVRGLAAASATESLLAASRMAEGAEAISTATRTKVRATGTQLAVVAEVTTTAVKATSTQLAVVTEHAASVAADSLERVGAAIESVAAPSHQSVMRLVSGRKRSRRPAYLHCCCGKMSKCED